jgi:DeoR/GlpR family transcriptional regulator of sugar metabolism
MSEKASEKMSEKTPDRILRLVSSNHDITIAELAQAIGVTSRTIERNIKKLQSQGRLKRVGPDKGGFWDMLIKETKREKLNRIHFHKQSSLSLWRITERPRQEMDRFFKNGYRSG